MAVESIKSTNTDSLVLCYKRRKRRRIIEEEPNDPIQIDIEKLPDALLFEVLYRLPCRWALQYKSVSKRWCSLISHPQFVRTYIHHRHQFRKSDTYPFTLVLYYGKQFNNNILALPFYDDSGDGGGGSDGLDFLNFLPDIELARKGYTFSIEASFNDLLLVYSEVPKSLSRSWGPAFRLYRICNPLTKQWITLPCLPFRESYRFVLVGFICNLYSCDKEQGCTTNAHYSYKVVRILSPTESNTTQIHMEIFSSDTGEWCHSLVSSPRGLNPFHIRSLNAGVVACNGMLHWVDENDRTIKGFVVFDPFNEAQGCRYIDPPSDLCLEELVYLGVFQGRLRIFQKPIFGSNFSVWELEDYNIAGKWCLKYKIYFKDLVSEYADLVKIAKKTSPPGSLLAFHPNVGENVFLQFHNYIVLCNMQTKVLTMTGRLRDRGRILADNTSLEEYKVYAKYVFIVGQSSWPTPVPLPLKREWDSLLSLAKVASKLEERKELRATIAANTSSEV